MTRSSSSRTKKTPAAQRELKKLKSLLPTLKQKSSSSPMEIVLETIRYIRQLEDQLIDRFPADAVLDHSALSAALLCRTDSTHLRDIGNTD